MEIEKKFQASKKHVEYVNGTWLGGSLSSNATLLNFLSNYLNSVYFIRQETSHLNCD